MVDLDFTDSINIIVGNNAQGKTNLLESLFYGCIGKSFKNVKDKDLIKFEKEDGIIELNIAKKFREIKILIMLKKNAKKRILVNKIPIKRIGDMIGEINVVIFSPTELKLVKDSPEERRKFMDIDISQTNKRYFYNLSRFDKILANRNKLLKENKDYAFVKETIDIWDRALVEVSEKIYLERKKFVEEIAPYAQKAHEYISNTKENLLLNYKTGCMKEVGNNFKEKYNKLLKDNFDKDYKFGYTTLGPHRDDILISLNGNDVRNFASQGQQRTAALSLKLAELEIIKERVGEYPILLLDDVFSELDEQRREKLIKFADRTQTFITCTEIDNKLTGQIYEVKDGIIKKC